MADNKDKVTKKKDYEMELDARVDAKLRDKLNLRIREFSLYAIGFAWGVIVAYVVFVVFIGMQIPEPQGKK